MVYLDYSATTPVDKRVLDSFVMATNDYIGNPNSLHRLGVDAKRLIDASTKQIASILKVHESEIIYTSGSSEANNLAIKGICEKYASRGKHIITTNLEHSSIYGPISYLTDRGFDVDFVKLNKDGSVDLNDLKKLMRDDTILVSINSVNSEIGINQNIRKIAKIIKPYHKCFFHVDMTQAIGKIPVDLDDVDLASFSAHKMYGIKGIGVLIKKDNIILEPIIHGGKSTTVYRSGTPALGLIVSLSKALRLVNDNLDKNYNYVKEINKYLRDSLEKYDGLYINSNDICIPHILNFSLIGVKPETLLHALEEYEIYISTQSACSTGNSSKAVMTLTNNLEKAKSSVRISLSHLTTKDDIDYFLKCFDNCYRKFTSLRK